MIVKRSVASLVVFICVSVFGAHFAFPSLGMYGFGGRGGVTPNVFGNPGTVGMCASLNAAGTQMHNIKSLGRHPSAGVLKADLKALQMKTLAASRSAGAMLAPAFSGVETANTELRQTVSQLKRSGDYTAATAQSMSAGVATLGTAFESLVNLSQC